MLDMIDFKKEFITCCRNELYAAGAGDICIEEHEVNKLQRGILNSLIFRRPEDICAPTLYVEDYYEMYRQGWSVDGLSRNAVETVIGSLPQASIFAGKEPDISRNADMLRVRLISLSRNRDYLKNVPYTEAGCGLVFIAAFEAGEYRAVITEPFLGSSGLSREELFEKAFSNTLDSCPAFLCRLEDATVSPVDARVDLLTYPDALDCPVEGLPLVLSNRDMFWGAGTLFYPGVMEKIHAILKGDFYVLPSSVHELIILAEEGSDPQHLAELVRSANRSIVLENDILADDIFICRSCELSRVSYGGIVPSPGVLPC